MAAVLAEIGGGTGRSDDPTRVRPKNRVVRVGSADPRASTGRPPDGAATA